MSQFFLAILTRATSDLENLRSPAAANQSKPSQPVIQSTAVKMKSHKKISTTNSPQEDEVLGGKKYDELVKSHQKLNPAKADHGSCR
jgi:hypothetical protein